jgi:hypothetical protein
MTARTGKGALALVAGLLSLAVCTHAATPEKFGGAIAGSVASSSGIPQMGATVLLLDGFDRLLYRTLTDESGGFLFRSLAPGAYSVRVSLASFFPALKRNIAVQPGMQSLLSVNLAGALSSIELVYSAKTAGQIMNDDWKWTLRTSSATRPVLRYAPQIGIRDAGDRIARITAAFSDTRGVVKVSASDEGIVSQSGNAPDLGTAFAVATSLFGKNQLSLSGNVGYSSARGIPTAGFRTTFSRGPVEAASSEVSLTMRQITLPQRAGMALVTGQAGAAPPLRTMSAGFLDHTSFTPNLRFEYGFSLEMVSFLDTLTFFSPYGRLTYDGRENGKIDLAFSSGLPPAGLFPAFREADDEFQPNLTALAMFPRVSLRNGHARVQRADSIELAYTRVAGSRTYSVAGYREYVSNGAFTLFSPSGRLPAGDVLPDLVSNSAVYNIGDYFSSGYMASLTQAAGERLSLSVAGGSGNALIPEGPGALVEESRQLRTGWRHGQRRWLAARVFGVTPWTGTHYAVSYRWADGRSLTAPHAYLTQNVQSDVGLNLHFRQPVPGVTYGRGRVEATADLFNILEQGYLPLTTAQGTQVILLHTPRSVRGGLSFIF